MGLPVKLVCCVNVNDIVFRALESGDFSIHSDVKASLSSAMDIQVPYNMERLLYFKSGCDSNITRQCMEKFESDGQLSIPDDILLQMKTCLRSHKVTDKEILETIAWCWKKYDYAICPHTATAVHYYLQRKETSDSRLICIATASFAKFSEVLELADVKTEVPKDVMELTKRPVKYVDMLKDDDWDAILRSKIEGITHLRKGSSS